jgi:signal transduction histidine kinase
LQNEKLESERMIMLRSRQHQLSEITGNIAHQWQQPLAELGSIMANLEARLNYAQVEPSKAEILTTVKKSTRVIRHLSNTINVFQGFFHHSKNDHIFSINEVMDEIIQFVSDGMKNNGISLKYTVNGNAERYGNTNAFSQVILTLLQNAKEALLERVVLDPYIHIVLNAKDKNKFTLEVRDNAGGIYIKPITSIFNNYMTNKTEGSGIGLYIAKKIIEENLNGVISVKNDLYGAVFTIECVQ